MVCHTKMRIITADDKRAASNKVNWIVIPKKDVVKFNWLMKIPPPYPKKIYKELFGYGYCLVIN